MAEYINVRCNQAGVVVVVASAIFLNVVLAADFRCPPRSLTTFVGYQTHPICKCTEQGYALNSDSTSCLLVKQHGESCQDVSTMCDVKKDLSCINGVCQCDQPGHWNSNKYICINNRVCANLAPNMVDVFKYDATIQNCVAMIDFVVRNADIDFDCPGNASLIKTDSNVEGNGPPRFNPTSSSVCVCNDNFTAHWNHESCIITKFHGEECNFDFTNRCDVKSNLACMVQPGENKGLRCLCGKGKVWGSEKGKCLIEAEQYCSPELYGNTVVECVQGASCEAGTCKCGEAFLTQNGSCLAKNGHSCPGSVKCINPSICIDGTCSCPNPVQQYYDTEVETCKSFAGSSCKPPNMSLCTENAECSYAGICSCLSGYRRTKEGFCVVTKKHGESCLVTECDSNRGLACVEGVCACVDSTARYSESTGCLVPMGSACGRINPFSTSGNQIEYRIRCESGSECNQPNDRDECGAGGKKAPGLCVPK